jgi:hypothetical protein
MFPEFSGGHSAELYRIDRKHGDPRKHTTQPEGQWFRVILGMGVRNAESECGV